MDTIIPDLVALTGLIFISAAMLVTARQKLTPATDTVVEEVNHLLPQTQCAQCGYPGCRPYAEAMVSGEAINLCPPGGETTVRRLATLLAREAVELIDEVSPHKVFIREADCIGCTLCIAACPVDAIIGSQQQMHTVIEDLCTGCDLCIEPCPVDCIDLVPLPPLEEPAMPVTENACINCGWCVTACPRGLQPQHLFRTRNQPEIAAGFNLDQCIECNRCDQVCPSALPLTDSFRVTRQCLERLRRDQSAIAGNETRYIARERRQSQAESRIISRASSSERKNLLDSIRAGQ